MIKEKFNEKIKISEDTELLYRLAINNNLEIVNQYSLIYVKHDDNSVNFLKYNAYKERKITLKKIFSYPKSNLIRKQIKRKLMSDCFFGIAKFYASNENPNLVRLEILKSAILYPNIRFKEKVYIFLHPLSIIKQHQ